ncbi:MAG: guanine deaminase [Casimicrobiaceae bacterium]|nr:guanine deaminase [Casimicrobiaceae bacterium]MCX8097672.1 guanine deaminase [Casimicrobiaceae bacterium]MDW8312265.1 guanine deaminase [Burkholderiales bacterium]
MSACDRFALRSSVLTCLADPGLDGRAQAALRYEPDALVVVADGRIAEVAPFEALASALGPSLRVIDRRGGLLVPGLIDAHVHAVQLDVIASEGAQLIDWLERYTFPAETAFADPEHAHATARFFLNRLLEHGTTTAAVFGSVHEVSVEALFAAAAPLGMALIAGKCHMDRHAPIGLTDTVEGGLAQARALIERWHGAGANGRLRYAITPRFAASSTPAQLVALGALARQYPEVYVQSHVAENRAEVAWIAELFPEARSYLDVYDRVGLVRERSLWAHCIYLDERDRARLAETGAASVFCPSSNLFLGSGLFDLKRALRAGNRVALGSDVGAGTSLSMLATLADAYKVQQLLGNALSPAYGLYLATLGGARALGLHEEIGSIEPGKWADFVLLDPEATALLARRSRLARERGNPLELFFAFMILGDDRAVAETWIAGRPVYRRDTLSAKAG